MDFLPGSYILSRMQFALTAIFHMLWPVLTTGMGIYLVVVEILWLRTKNPDYYYHARFWSTLYVLNFGVGVATGIPMEFQFGTNWAHLLIQVRTKVLNQEWKGIVDQWYSNSDQEIEMPMVA